MENTSNGKGDQIPAPTEPNNLEPSLSSEDDQNETANNDSSRSIASDGPAQEKPYSGDYSDPSVSDNSVGQNDEPNKEATDGAGYVTPSTPTSTAPALASLPSSEPVENAVVQSFEEPAPAKQGSSEAPTSRVTAGILVLQWLTYAFWLWTSWAITILAGSILADAIVPDVETGEFSLYALSASLVLLIASVVCDVFYSRKEVPHKKGGSSAVMLIHAVIFALSMVGALISTIFALVSLVLSSSSPEPIVVWALTSLVAAIVYAILLVRTALIARFPIFRKILIIFMSALTAVLIISAIVGPVANIYKTKDDKLIRDNISSVARAVNNYVDDEGKLPDSLKDIDLKGDAKSLVDRELVKYTPGQKISDSSSLYGTTYDSYKSSLSVRYNFTLCATFKDKYEAKYSYSSRYLEETSASSFYIREHDKGEQCFKLYATSYNVTTEPR